VATKAASSLDSVCGIADGVVIWSDLVTLVASDGSDIKFLRRRAMLWFGASKRFARMKRERREGLKLSLLIFS
jgi:hypothetical protein